MKTLKTYQMEFRSGDMDGSRYVRIKAYSYKEACKQLFSMYVSVSTELIDVEIIEPVK